MLSPDVAAAFVATSEYSRLRRNTCFIQTHIFHLRDNSTCCAAILIDSRYASLLYPSRKMLFAQIACLARRNRFRPTVKFTAERQTHLAIASFRIMNSFKTNSNILFCSAKVPSVIDICSLSLSSRPFVHAFNHFHFVSFSQPSPNGPSELSIAALIWSATRQNAQIDN